MPWWLTLSGTECHRNPANLRAALRSGCLSR